MISLLVFVLLLGYSNGFANSEFQKTGTCKSPQVRREWRSLSVAQRTDYIKAVKCMMDKPPISKKHFPVVTNRYEDFVALHANATAGGAKLDGPASALPRMMMGGNNGIHGTATFLPWHRYVLQVWEDAIRTECGWKEPTPYWDWHLDTPSGGGSWLKSPLFDAVSGFGGNGAPRASSSSGSSGATPTASAAQNPLAGLFGGLGALFGGGGRAGGCVTDGPFKDEKLHIGPMGAMRPNNTRCLTRNLNAATAHGAAAKETFQHVLTTSKTFGDLRAELEMPVLNMGGNGTGGPRRMAGSLHTVGHGGVGGEMLDVFTSTNDPLFFLHHAGLDRVWAIWQELNSSRIYDVAPASAAANPMSFFGRGRGGANLTLDSPIWMGFAAPDKPVRVLMDTQNRDGKGILCYKYEKDASEYLK